MVTTKTTKNQKDYCCATCEFTTSSKRDYSRHLVTNKHIMMSNDGLQKPTKPEIYKCDCGKLYKYRQGYYRHRQACAILSPTHVNNNVNDVSHLVNQKPDNNDLILKLLAQNKDLMELLSSQQQQQHQQQQQQKQETKCLVETIQEQSVTIQEQSATMQQTIKDIIPKIGNNNNNNTTNNNKFNLQVFLNEDCKDAINFSEFIENMQVTVEDLENQAQLGYVGGISKLFLENMKELGVNKRPIHCTDKKRNTLYIKENDKWDKDGSQEQLLYGIKVVTGRANQTLCDMKEDNPVEYSDIDSAFSNKCEDIQRNLLPVFPRETTFGKVIDSISNGSIVDKEP
jgi:hypothetical protein